MLYARGHCVASDANAFYSNYGAMSSDKLSDSGSEYVPGFCDEQGSDDSDVFDEDSGGELRGDSDPIVEQGWCFISEPFRATRPN